MEQTQYTTCQVEIYNTEDCTGNVLYYVVGSKLKTCVNHIMGPIDGGQVHDLQFKSVKLNCPRWFFKSQTSTSQTSTSHTSTSGTSAPKTVYVP